MTENKWNVRWILNPAPNHGAGPEFLSPAATRNVRALHESLPEYKQTPLVRLDAVAESLGIKAVYVKDESSRFALKAFKGLGGIYALYRAVCEQLNLDPAKTTFATLQSPELRSRIEQLVFVTTTDGNHGKGVAWAAAKLGCQAHVYMPKGSVEARAQAIREAGKAEVTITSWNYDDTVRYAAKMADTFGWILIQDTSWPGYEKVPSWIIQGYTTMAHEAAAQLDAAGVTPTHVFLQAGVGAMAGGVLGYLRSRYTQAEPSVTIVEPDQVACIFRSAQVHDGAPHAATGSGQTIMAGLNCGEPCTVTWPILRDQADAYVSCPDYVAAHGMRVLHDAGVVSGESGAVTAGLADLLGHPELAELKTQLGLNQDSVLLLFSTEGDTDPQNYHRIVFGDAYALPR